MKPKVCIETTIPSYLTANPSPDPLVASRQRLTHEWWQNHRHRFSLFTSERVLVEVGSGDPTTAAKRMATLADVPELDFKPKATDLARQFLALNVLPAKSLEDAVHIAIATVHGMDYLATWNCRHIANAVIMKRLDVIAGREGYSLPALCTPAQLMGD